MKKLIFRVSVIAIIFAAAWGGYRLVRQLPQRQQQIPITKVRQGDVIMRAYTRGELRAVRSVTLTAPNLFGTVQVTRLAPLGAFAREKDLIVEFDGSEVQGRLEERQLELEQTDQQIKKSEAELAIRNNQDQVELLKTRYAVRRAELEVKRNELLSAIDARKNLLNLEEAQRRLKQLESDIKSRQQQAEAELAVLRQQRERALIEVAQEKQRLTQTRLLAPISGLVSIHQNRFGGGRMFGMQIPDIREGDQVQPGMPVADVLDLSELEVVAKVGELDRANLREDQDVTMQLDALAGEHLHGKIKSMSGTASANIFSGDPSKKFDVVFSVDMKQLLSAVGAKPEQIRKILETAARNRNRPVQLSMASFSMGGPGGLGGPGSGPLGEPSGQSSEREVTPRDADSAGTGRRRGGRQGEAQRGGQEGEARQGGFRREGGGQMSPEDRQKRREAMQKALGGRNIRDLSPEERQELFAKLRGSARPSVAAPTEKELAEAKLPPPPEEDQMEVLLRPGLLADVEITVEKIPNAIYIPAQAVFQKDNKPVVYVRTSSGFEERSVKLLKQSESTMVISEGLKPGESVALSDPTASRSEKREEKPGGGASPMGPSGAGGRG
jgi:HlyD family secretion protein